MQSIKRFATASLVLLCLIGLLVAVLGAYRFAAYRDGIVEPMRDNLIERTREAASRIDAELMDYRQAAEGLATGLTAAEVSSEDEVLRLLRATVVSNDAIYGGAVAFRPGAFEPERRLFHHDRFLWRRFGCRGSRLQRRHAGLPDRAQTGRQIGKRFGLGRGFRELEAVQGLRAVARLVPLGAEVEPGGVVNVVVAVRPVIARAFFLRQRLFE